MNARRGIPIAVVVALILFCSGQAPALTVEQVVMKTQKRLAVLEGRVTALQAENAVLKERIAELEGMSLPMGIIGTNIKFYPGELNGLKGPHLIFEGLNVHVRSGSGTTDDGGSPTGLGNLIVGYNEQPPAITFGRGGSHNIVGGARNEYKACGGLVVGENNRVGSSFASVTGGYGNTALGFHSSVSGGKSNETNGPYASISGGYTNSAEGSYSSIAGGNSNNTQGQ